MFWVQTSGLGHRKEQLARERALLSPALSRTSIHQAVAGTQRKPDRACPGGSARA